MNTALVRRTGTAAAAAALVLASASTATAATWHHHDATHDVVSIGMPRTGADSPSDLETTRAPSVGRVDIDRIRVRHGAHMLFVRLHTRSALPSSMLTSEFLIRTPTRTYDVERDDFEGFQLAAITTDAGPVHCPQVSIAVRPARHTVLLTAPRFCLGKPKWVRVAAALELDHGNRVYVDDAEGNRLDRRPHFSPRIHVG